MLIPFDLPFHLPFGIGLPSLLLIVQLGVGIMAIVDLARSMRARRWGLAMVGQAILAVLLTTLGFDGLFIGSDIIGRITYDLNIDPTWVRPGTIGLIVLGAVLWSFDRTTEQVR